MENKRLTVYVKDLVGLKIYSKLRQKQIKQKLEMQLNTEQPGDEMSAPRKINLTLSIYSGILDNLKSGFGFLRDI